MTIPSFISLAIEPYTRQGVYNEIYLSLGGNIQKVKFKYSINLNDTRIIMYPCGGGLIQTILWRGTVLMKLWAMALRKGYLYSGTHFFGHFLYLKKKRILISSSECFSQYFWTDLLFCISVLICIYGLIFMSVFMD